MNKIICVMNCTLEGINKASFSEKEIESLNYTSSPELLTGVTYIAPKQYVHVEEMTISGRKIQTKKIFLIAVRDGVAESIISVSLSALRRMHLGEVTDEEITIPAEIRSGRYMPIKDTQYYSSWEEGGLCLRGEATEGWVAKDTAFTVSKRHIVWETTPIDTKNGLNNAVTKDKKNMLLSKHKRPVFRQEVSCPDWEELGIPSEFREFIMAFRHE